MRRILIIDHLQKTRRRLSDILLGGGYQVLEADSYKAALALLTEGPPDLVLLDIILPDESSLALSNQLRSLPGFEAVPIVLLSHLPPLGIEDGPLAQYFNGYIDKKVTPEALIDKVRAYLK